MLSNETWVYITCEATFSVLYYVLYFECRNPVKSVSMRKDLVTVKII